MPSRSIPPKSTQPQLRLSSNDPDDCTAGTELRGEVVFPGQTTPAGELRLVCVRRSGLQVRSAHDEVVATFGVNQDEPGVWPFRVRLPFTPVSSESGPLWSVEWSLEAAITRRSHHSFPLTVRPAYLPPVGRDDAAVDGDPCTAGLIYVLEPTEAVPLEGTIEIAGDTLTWGGDGFSLGSTRLAPDEVRSIQVSRSRDLCPNGSWKHRVHLLLRGNGEPLILYANLTPAEAAAASGLPWLEPGGAEVELPVLQSVFATAKADGGRVASWATEAAAEPPPWNGMHALGRATNLDDLDQRLAGNEAWEKTSGLARYGHRDETYVRARPPARISAGRSAVATVPILVIGGLLGALSEPALAVFFLLLAAPVPWFWRLGPERKVAIRSIAAPSVVSVDERLRCVCELAEDAVGPQLEWEVSVIEQSGAFSSGQSQCAEDIVLRGVIDLPTYERDQAGKGNEASGKRLVSWLFTLPPNSPPTSGLLYDRRWVVRARLNGDFAALRINVLPVRLPVETDETLVSEE